MTDTFSRRVVMGALVAAPIAIAASSSSAAAQPIIRPGFARRLERARRLEAAAGSYETTVYEPAMARFEAAVAKFRPTKVDMGVNHRGSRIIFSTSNPTQVAIAKSLVTKPISDIQYMAGCERIVSANARLEDRRNTARITSGLAGSLARSNRFGDVVSCADWAFINMPVTSATELAMKIDFMIERQVFNCDAAIAAIQIDARALAA